jgi:hypothetical protein
MLTIPSGGQQQFCTEKIHCEHLIEAGIVTNPSYTYASTPLKGSNAPVSQFCVGGHPEKNPVFPVFPMPIGKKELGEEI